MSNISVDISKKIDASTRTLLTELHTVSEFTDDPLVIVGAGARDLIFKEVYGIDPGRATLDLDFAVRLTSWAAYNRFTSRMTSMLSFTPDGNAPHRFRSRAGFIVDIIPFGDLEDPRGNIRWPSNSSDMRTLGFQEALGNSIAVRVAEGVEVRVSLPPALVVMKLLSWDEAQPHRARDAQDIDFMLREYEHAGNERRIYSDDRDLTSLPDFDQEFEEKMRLLVQLKQGILDGKQRTA